MNTLKLFCIPYSGGSGSSFYILKKHLNPEIELIPLDLPGHGRRIKEALLHDVFEAARDLADQVQGHLRAGEEYAINGHSLGSLLGFEVVRELMNRGVHPPRHLIVSGRKSPRDISAETTYYKLPDSEFLDIVFYYGGTTREVMENEELAAMFLPILKADFQMAETYQCSPEPFRCPSDLLVINGQEDASVSEVDMSRWQEVTEGECAFERMPGTHFFLFEYPKVYAEKICAYLMPWQERSSL